MSRFDLKTKQKASEINPKVMLLFSYPKTGKTHLISKLDNSLIIDFDNGGTDYYDAVKVKINSLQDLDDLVAQFTEEQPHFKAIALDTITTLYSDICGQLAVRIYNDEKGTTKSLDWDIKRLEYGAGYSYLREALQKVISFFKSYCDTLILSGHVADKAINTSTTTTNIKDIDLEGKLKNIISVKVDAVGFLYRKESGKNYLSFISSEELIGGTRSEHLSNKEFLVSEKVENNLITYWDTILL